MLASCERPNLSAWLPKEADGACACPTVRAHGLTPKALVFACRHVYAQMRKRAQTRNPRAVLEPLTARLISQCRPGPSRRAALLSNIAPNEHVRNAFTPLAPPRSPPPRSRRADYRGPP